MGNAYVKDPDAVVDYQINWATWLGIDSIGTSTWTVPSGLTSTTTTNTTTTATVWLSGGTAGQYYVVTNKIITVTGRTEEQAIIVKVENTPTFTYYDSLSDNRSKVRFHLQDTVSGAGPKPGDANFTDAEIDGLVTTEGTWQRAVAGAFETLAAAWRRYPNFSTDGFSLQRTAIEDGYAAQAKEWRAKYGTASGTSRAGSRSVTRVDGYSQDVASDDV